MKRLIRKSDLLKAAKNFEEFGLNVPQGTVEQVIGTINPILIFRDIHASNFDENGYPLNCEVVTIYRSNEDNMLYVLTTPIIDNGETKTLGETTIKDTAENEYQAQQLLKDKYGPYLTPEQIDLFLGEGASRKVGN